MKYWGTADRWYVGTIVKGAWLYSVLFTVCKHKYNRQKSYMFFCKLIVATFTAIHATWKLTVFLYGRDWGAGKAWYLSRNHGKC